MKEAFIIVYISLCLTHTLSCKFGERYLVSTKNGIVEGAKEFAVPTGKVYYRYSGIPFAKPPVGELRFEPPQPVEKWPFILDATEEQPICLQSVETTVKTEKILGSEDCLYLNIYTPVPPGQTKDLAVMVWIYGGGFFEGDITREIYGPDYLMNEDVIVVPIAYRLGIFGFFSTGDLQSPGNNGLKDLILGLQWVKNNIESFGGDPNRITIFSESAGAVATSILTQTPLTKGLYNRAIMQSGLSHVIWAFSKKSAAVNDKTAELLGLTYSSSADLKHKLKLVPSRDLFAMSTLAANLVYGERPFGGLATAPVIEPKHPNAVVTRDEFDVLKSGDFNLTPLLIGFTSLETVDYPLNALFTAYLTNANLESSYLVPENFNIKDPKVKKHVGDLIKKRYFGSVNAKIFGDRQLIPFAADVFFYVTILEAVSLYAKHTNVSLYEFSYLGVRGNPLRSYNWGVGHGEELNYLFYRETSPKVSNLTDVRVTRTLTRLWANFAKEGNPTPRPDPLLQNVRWPTVGKDRTYLDINEHLVVKQDPHGDDYRFWSYLFSKYRLPNDA
uniref:Carboxylesterase 5 n=1 Tax=Holotrichia parallela TaxID=93412 RepID=A0A6G7SJS7_HOLPA|nr:carboxylesterase 5 [Holotrichia parallela]